MKLTKFFVLALIGISFGLTPGSAEARRFSTKEWIASQGYERNITARRGWCTSVYTDHPKITDDTPIVVASTTMPASWYGKSLHGNDLNSGLPFHECDATVVASNKFPPGTVLRLTYKGRSITVVVQDSGGEKVTERLDLARGAMQTLEPDHETVGVIEVLVEVLEFVTPSRTATN